jgi:putative membrane protein
MGGHEAGPARGRGGAVSFWTRIFASWAITAAGVFLAVLVLQQTHPPMIVVTGSMWVTILIMAAVLGLLNAFVRPILNLLSCGCIVLTLGLFMLVVNAFVFWLASTLVPALHVQVPWGAFWGAVIVSIVSFLANVFLPLDPDES